MAILKYKSSSGEIKTLSNVTVNLSNNLEESVLINGENITLSSKSNPIIDGEDRVLVTKDIPVQFNTIDISNKVYNYMLNSQGEIVSYRSYYTIPAYSDEFIKAIYSDSQIEAKSLINWIGKGYGLDKDNGTVYFYISCDILDEEEKLDWHLLLSTKDLPDEEMIPETAGIGNFSIDYAPTNKYTSVRYSLKYPALFNRHVTLKVRAYATVEKEGVENKIYTKVVTIQL